MLGCTRPKAGAITDRWLLHQNPQGFQVVFPRGSRVETSPDNRITVSLPDAGEVLVQPFLLEEPQEPGVWLEKALPYLQARFPAAEIARLTALEPGKAVAELRYTRDGIPGAAYLLCRVEGGGGMLFAVAAPVSGMPALRATLARVAGSFSLTEPKTPPPPAETAYVAWSEPEEGMFTLEVPEGWLVEGGLTRKNPWDTRYQVEAVAPDARAKVLLGDREVPPFALLTEEGTAFGLKEGQEFEPGLDATFILRRYLTGAAFARDYVQKRFGPGLPTLAITRQTDLPTLTAQLAGTPGPDRQMALGEVQFTATREGRPWKGYLLAGTTLTKAGKLPGGVWTVDYLYGYWADAGEEGQARQTLYRMLRTQKLEQDWLERQPPLSLGLEERFQRAQEAILSHLEQVLGLTAAVETLSGMKSGQSRYQDPQTGRVLLRASAGNIYWRPEGEASITLDLLPLLQY